MPRREHVDVLIGADGSVVIRHIQEGRSEAESLVERLLGGLDESAYTHAALWDWLRVESGVLDGSRLARLRALGPETTVTRDTPDGPEEVLVRIQETAATPRFDLPRYSMTRAHGSSARWKPWLYGGAALVVIVAAIAVLASGEPRYQPATFDEAFTAWHSPPAEVRLLDRIRRDDGRHHAIALDVVLQSLGNVAIVRTEDGRAWFLSAPGLGNHVRELRGTSSPLHLETTLGPTGKPRYVNASGAFVPVDVRALELAEPGGGHVPVKGNDPNDPAVLVPGQQYAVEGGVRITEAGVLLYSPSFAQIRHVLKLGGISPEAMATVLPYIVQSNLAVTAYGTLVSSAPGSTPASSGWVPPDKAKVTGELTVGVLRVSRGVFVKR